MPEGATPQVPVQPQAPASPGGGAGSPTQRPAPFGQSPATQQTPNRGAEAAAMQHISTAMRVLDEAVKQTGLSSELGETLAEVMKKLRKFVPPGADTPATRQNALQNMAMGNARQNGMMQMLRAQQARQAQGVGAGGGAAAPQAPPSAAGAAA